MMTPTKDTAELETRLNERRARLEELTAELERIPAAIDRHRETLGRSLSVGEADTVRKPLRAEIQKLEATRAELEAAISILAPEVESLEVEYRAARAVELEAEADSLELKAHEAAREAWKEFHRLAATFAPILDKVDATYNQHRAVRAEALRAAGAHREDVFRAEGKLRGVPVEGVSPQEFAVWRQTAHTLASYGREKPEG